VTTEKRVSEVAGEGKGWISLYRKIQDSWLWEDKPFARGQAWIDLLLQANHKDKKKLSKGELVEIKKGSFLTSEQILAARWGWSRKKVRSFLDVLEKDEKVHLKRTSKGTSLTIVNWDLYQDKGTTEDTTEDTTEEHQKNIRRYTNNNDNNDNNDNNNITTTTTIYNYDIYSKNHAKNNSCSSGSDENFNIFQYMQQCGFVSISPILAEKINADIELYSLEEVKRAIEIADSNGKHTYNYVKGILEKRRAGVNEKLDKEKAREQAFKEFLEED